MRYRLFSNRLKAGRQDLRAVRRSAAGLLVAAGVGITVVATGSLTYLETRETDLQLANEGR